MRAINFASTVLCLTAGVCGALVERAGTQYLFTFGDSYSKVGWTYSGTKPSSRNIIGNPAYPGLTTSGGEMWVENLATDYNDNPQLIYDFAQGGAVVNKSLVNYGNDDLITQSAKFIKYIATPKSVPYTGSNSIFLFWFGQNDCYRGYNQTDHETLYTAIAVSYVNIWEQLYTYGARNFIILTLGAISQSYLISQMPDDQYQKLKDAMNLFESRLRSAVRTFTLRHDDVKYRYVDAGRAFMGVLNNYKQYGAPNMSCYKAQDSHCLWADHFHPSTTIHKALASQIASYDTFQDFFTVR